MTTSHQVPLEQVQGNITPGFRKDFVSLLFLRFPDAAFAAPLGSSPAAARVRAWLGSLLPHIASAEEVATYNRLYRLVKGRIRDTAVEQDGVQRFTRTTYVNVAFTAKGLGCLLGSEPWKDDPNVRTRLEAFRIGMCNRNGVTGDSTTDIAAFTVRDGTRSGLKDAAGHPVPEAAQAAQVAHAVVIIGADFEQDLHDEVAQQQSLAAASQLTVVQDLRGQSLGTGREHFGFKDGLSQPDPDDPLAGWESDGEQVVAPGELIRGCTPEPERQDAHPVPPWEMNGSYLVFRQLSQDVAGFWRQAETVAEQLYRPIVNGAPAGSELAGILTRPSATEPSPAGKLAAAWMIGRWQSGAKLTTPGDPARFPHDPADDGPLPDGATTITRADFAGDPLGARCPIFAHIRKSNPRVVTPGIVEADLRVHRIVRRGIPYTATADTGGDEKGLLFLAYQARINDGFELIQKQWINSPNFGKPAGVGADGRPGQDPLSVDAQRDASNHLYQPTGREDPAHPYALINLRRLVTARAGGYFFAPSIGALDELARGGSH
jgi:Dyp-type peroxidase family